MNRIGKSFTLFLFIWCSCQTTQASVYINPSEYGIKESKSAIDNYNILLKCHQDAVRLDKKICYEGIDSIEIEIPKGAKGIPLVRYTDFGNTKFIVLNKTKDISLFFLKGEVFDVQVSSSDIDNGNFKDYPVLRKGSNVLVISDDSLWVKQRKGYNYGATRRDILLLKGGVSQNRTIKEYDNPYSSPKCQYFPVCNNKTIIKNITLDRRDGSTHKTFLFELEYLNDIELSKVIINTPTDNTLFGDAAIQIHNCVDVVLNDITINDTYSQLDKYGYGVSIGNVFNLKVNRMHARAKWGIFGTNCINKTLLTNCDINRFDIHFYGRNVTARKCNFVNLQNAFSSFYGLLLFEKCIFHEFTPVEMKSSYNAYTPYDIVWRHCDFFLDSNNNRLLSLSNLEAAHNPRNELSRKCLPNINIYKCNIYLDPKVTKWMIVDLGKVRYMSSLDYLSNIIINGLVVYNNESKSSFDIFSGDVSTSNRVSVIGRNVYVKEKNRKIRYKMDNTVCGKNIDIKINGEGVPRLE